MSERRVVLRGVVRVDARRARAKLREHLLLDLNSYSLEIARAAIALGAEAMNVRWDADEVVFAFDGTAIEPERVARLLDFALSETADHHGAALRALALGVNAALGLGASEIVVTSTSAAGAFAARFTPELFSDEAGADPRAESSERPDEAFPIGTVVRIKKRFGLAVLGRALSNQVPPEVALLVSHTRDCPLALSENGEAVARPPEPPVLAKVSFPLPEARRAIAELFAGLVPCRIDATERGVRLLTLGWTPLAGLPPDSLPARVLVDADALPTNASRSALQEDSPLARELLPAAAHAFDKLLSALVARATGQALPEGVEVATADEGLWRETLGHIVAEATVALRAGSELHPKAQALLQLPVFDTSAGGRISVAQVLASRPLRVWKSEQPLPEELAPWLGGVVWLRGHAVERVLDELDVEDAATLVGRAREGAARRARLLAHEPAAPGVPGGSAELARERFELASGLQGELVLLAPLPGGTPRPSLLRVFVEGHLLEAIPVEPGFCPLAFDAAVSWPGRLRPRFDYDAVERDAHLSEALHAATLVAIGIADRAASRLESLAGAEREALARILRDAVLAFSEVPSRLGRAHDPEQFRRAFPALHRAKIFETTAGRPVSLSELAEYAKEKGALCEVRAPESAPRPAPDGRPVLISRGREADSVLAVLEGEIERIPYGRGVASAGAAGDTPEGRRAALAHAVSEERVRQGLGPLSARLWFEKEGLLVLVAPGVAGASIESHRGIALGTAPLPRELSTAIVAFDDPTTVPDARFTGVHWRAKRFPAWYEDALVERLVAALEGDTQAQSELGLSPETRNDMALVVCLLARAVDLGAKLGKRADRPVRARDQKLAALLDRIEALPLFCSFDEAGALSAVSIRQARAKHGDRVPLLARAPGFATADWAPLLWRAERERELLTRLFPRAHAAEIELGPRRQAALAEAAKHALLASPARDLADLDVRRRPEDRVLSCEKRDELEVTLALPRPELTPGEPWVRLFFERRPVHALAPSEVGLPVVANVSSTNPADFVDFRAPSSEGLARFGARLREASLELLGQLASERLLLSDARALSLGLALADLFSKEAVQDLVLRPDFVFPTVQGGEAPLTLLAADGRCLSFGTERYPGWLRKEGRPSELDHPTLLLPAGDLGSLTRSLLVRLGYELRDTSAAIATLQRQRGGAAAAAPKLGGAPAHPVLRVSLWEVGVRIGDGELELVRGPGSSVSVVLLGGQATSFEVAMTCPIRAVVRVDALDLLSVRARLTFELERAAQQVLVRAAPEAEHLPAFVREALRRSIAARAELREESALRTAPVFEDTLGAWHSLDALVQSSPVSYTTLEPPFPEREAPALRLSESDAAGLRGVVELTSVDAELERQRAADERRNAPQAATVMLSAEQRACCFITTTVNVQGTTGEVGVLAPAHPELRGGLLHVDRRPLCRFSDGDGWPLISALNDDSVEPDPLFVAPADTRILSLVAERARDVARVALQRIFAPQRAIAARWLEDVPIRGFRVTGCLWLGDELPAAPKVRVYVGQQVAPMVRCLEARSARPTLASALPLEGDLLVRWEGNANGSPDVAAELASTLATLSTLTETWVALNELAERVAVELVKEARARKVDAAVLDEHALSLALVGLDVQAPELSSLDGKRLSVNAVLDELERTGMLWTSDGRGLAEGAFPGVAPAFFLPERGPLARVLAVRAPGSLRALGSLSLALPRPVMAVVPTPVPVAPEMQTESWWTRFSERLVAGVLGEEPRPSQLPEHGALFELVSSLRLTGSPVQALAVGRAKRALRYDASGKRLLLNPDEPVAARLLAAGTSEPGALAVMAAHAVCEINRALVEVTDGDERRALITLMKQL